MENIKQENCITKNFPLCHLNEKLNESEVSDDDDDIKDIEYVCVCESVMFKWKSEKYRAIVLLFILFYFTQISSIIYIMIAIFTFSLAYNSHIFIIITGRNRCAPFCAHSREYIKLNGFFLYYFALFFLFWSVWCEWHFFDTIC